MNRFMKGGLLALLFSLSSAPVYAANLPLLDPNFSIVPVCPTGGPLSAGAILQFIQNVMNAMISIGVIALVLAIAYAGVLFILTPTNPESRSKAKSVLGNAVIGFLIVLSAWIAVDFIMKLLYDGGGQFGPWNKILTVTDNSICIEEIPPSPIAGLPGGLVRVGINGIAIGTGANGAGGTSYGVGAAGAQCSVSNQACSVSSLSRYGLSSTQANVMSCIAVTESSGNPGTPPYNQTHPGSNSSACGTFQITQTTWNRTANGTCRSFSSCTNASCNAQVAAALVKNSGYSSWTCPGCNNKAQACVNKYGGN